MAEMCYPCPRTPVTLVPGLYTIKETVPTTIDNAKTANAASTALRVESMSWL